MSRRGRATLGVVAGAAVSCALWFGVRAGSAGPVGASASPPAVAAAATQPEPALPDGLLERLPVGRDVLGLPVMPEGDSEGRFYELVPAPEGVAVEGPLRVEYTLGAELTRRVFRVLERGRVKLGHVILLDPRTGRLLAYASTDLERFPPTRPYPAASLIKVITAAAALDRDAQTAKLPCRFRGSPYRLTPSRIDPPARGTTVSLQRALATSNNQCFAQLAVHAVGAGPLLEAITRFGWLARPAPAHAAGSADLGEDRYDVGRLGCGLAGCRITPLHAAQLAAALARGELVTPRWIDRITDARGRVLPVPAGASPRQVMTPELAAELRAMLVDTTVRGTARSAFRGRGGRPLLGPVQVAGKTGSLSGTDPKGRYEWFAGVAPADEPRVAVAVLLVQGHLWWRNASQIAAESLRQVFCEDGECRPEAAQRFIGGAQKRAAAAEPPNHS